MFKNGLQGVTLYGFESDVIHLQLAKGGGDTVKKTREAGMRHSH